MFRYSLLALSACSTLARADELDDLVNEESKAATSSSVAVDLPHFTPTAIKAPFLEQFTADWTERWSPSSAQLLDKEGKELPELNYVGKWVVEEPSVFKGMEDDKGLVLKDDARRAAISAPFGKSIDNKDNTLVLQYEVKMQKGLECGGAYVKLLTESPEGILAKEFSDKTPYTIMFGPDKCGSTNKVHFIFRHFNPVTGKHEEKHLASPPVAKISKVSTLYTLIVKPDQTFEIKIDEKSVKKGSLLEDFNPPVTGPKEIPDSSDVKPADWVDNEQIDDPEAVKPADWDEDQPFEIEDVEASKPETWSEDEPATIPDPDAGKPADWDEEEDGTWIAPQIPNPKCVNGQCGPWKRPMIKNPAYVGKWFAPKIANPAYKGIWQPKNISNPDYYQDLTPANFEPFSGIGFELWTMQGNILFDNIIVTHSEDDASELAKEWTKKNKVETELETAAAPKPKEHDPRQGYISSFASDPLGYAKQEVLKFVDLAQIDPLYAFKSMPEIAGGLIAALFTILAILGSLISMLSSPGSPAGAPTTKKVVAKEPAPSAQAPAEKGEATGPAIEAMDSPAAAAKERHASRKA